MYYIYLLWSLKNRYYTGFTSDLKQRFEQNKYIIKEAVQILFNRVKRPTLNIEWKYKEHPNHEER